MLAVLSVGSTFALRLWTALVWILRSSLAVSLDALLNLGVGDGKHAVHEIRKGGVFYVVSHCASF